MPNRGGRPNKVIERIRPGQPLAVLTLRQVREGKAIGQMAMASLVEASLLAGANKHLRRFISVPVSVSGKPGARLRICVDFAGRTRE